ncbi:MAG: GNAT family N-acetyltransferase [Streptosporangiaceae bacterium]
MNAERPTAGPGGTAAILRGIAYLAGLGAALGGIAGTIDWPLVGTFFGAVDGLAAGAVAGLADGLLLSYPVGRDDAGRDAVGQDGDGRDAVGREAAREAPPRWLVRVGSGVLAGAAAAVAALMYAGPITLPLAAAVALVVVAAVAGAAFGPLIRYGADLGRVRRFGRRQVPVTAGRVIGWGAVLGLVLGAVGGLIVGVIVYLPTAPVAAIEGAILGAVSGTLLALLAAGFVVLPTLRARRPNRWLNDLPLAWGSRDSEAMMSPPESLSHGQVTLRRWRDGDAAALLTAVTGSLDELLPWMPWADGYDTDRATGYLSDCEAQWEAGSAYNYAIVVGEAIVGSAGLHRRVGKGGLEIGYWVHSAWTGRGIATDAAAALTRAALDLPEVSWVEIYHDAANAASGRIPAKLGYTRLGERPSRDLGPAAPSETGTDVVWQITR